MKSAQNNTFKKSYFKSCNFFPKINIGKLHCVLILSYRGRNSVHKALATAAAVAGRESEVGGKGDGGVEEELEQTMKLLKGHNTA